MVAPGAAMRSACAIDSARPHAVHHRVGAAAELPVVVAHGAGAAPHGSLELVGSHDQVGAELRGEGSLVGMLGGGDEVDLGRACSQRRDGEESEGPAADQRHPARIDLGGRVDGAGGGLHEDGPFVGEIRRHRHELALVRDHQRRPAPAGALTEPALQAGLEVAEADALAVVDAPVRAGAAHRADPAGHAAQDRYDDGALARRRARPPPRGPA